jgi:hypothetical protein
MNGSVSLLGLIAVRFFMNFYNSCVNTADRDSLVSRRVI